jgi:hypothetical protein
MTEKEKWYCCKHCGSDDIMWSAYVDEHDKVVLIKERYKEIWCNACELFEEYIPKTTYKARKLITGEKSEQFRNTQ